MPMFASASVLRLPMVPKDVRRKVRRSDVGYILRRPERLITDKLCFVEPRRLKVGTVLVDCSGSMCIDRNDIVAATRTTNGATISGYCAADDRGRQGAIWVLSAGGKVARALPNPVTGYVPWISYNCCDLPALMWLSKQKRPLLWVSDGGVNGYEGRTSAEINKVCYGVVERFGIERLKNLGQLSKYLKEKNR
jgi:hypothetical protein